MTIFIFTLIATYRSMSIYEDFLGKDVNIVASHASHEHVTINKETNGFSVKSKFYNKFKGNSTFKVNKIKDEYIFKMEEGYLCSLDTRVILCDEEQTWILKPQTIGFKISKADLCITVKKEGKLGMRDCSSKKDGIYQTFDFMVVDPEVKEGGRKEKEKKVFNLTIKNGVGRPSEHSTKVCDPDKSEERQTSDFIDPDKLKSITKKDNDVGVEVEHVKRGLLDENSTPTDSYFKPEKRSQCDQDSQPIADNCPQTHREVDGSRVEKSYRIHKPQDDEGDPSVDRESELPLKSTKEPKVLEKKDELPDQPVRNPDTVPIKNDALNNSNLTNSQKCHCRPFGFLLNSATHSPCRQSRFMTHMPCSSIRSYSSERRLLNYCKPYSLLSNSSNCYPPGVQHSSRINIGDRFI